MKQNLRFLTSLVVMLLASATTWAAATDWTTVKVKPMALSELTLTDTVYILNVGTDRYLSHGEAWGHQVIVSPRASAAKCVVNKLDDGYYNIKNEMDGSWTNDSQDNNVVWICSNDGQVGNGNKCTFGDHNDNADLSKWTIEAVDGQTNVYTIKGKTMEDGQYLGVNRWHATNVVAKGTTWGLYPDCIPGDSATKCQFKFFSVKLLEAKEILLAAVNMAENYQVSVDNAKALLSNENATLEQVEAEIEKLLGPIRKAGTTTRPTNVTAYLPNATPTAENTTPRGWTVTDANGAAATTGSSNGTSVCEFWNKGGRTLKTTVHLKAGVYRFSCEAQTRSGMHSKFFVNDNAIDIVTTGHNSSDAVQNFFNQGNGRNYISVKLPADADVTIGLTSDNTTGDHWTVWRNFYIESLGEDLPATALSIPAKDDNAHYATFSSAAPTVFAAEGTAVYGVSVDNGTIHLNELTKVTYKLADREKNEVEGYYVPANTGVLVKTASADAAEAQHHFPMEVLSVELPANQLKPANADGSVFTAQDGYRYYKLAYNNFTEKTGLGFYWGADNGVAFKLKAGLAYLAVPSIEATAKGFRFDGVTDGIDGVSMDGNKAQVIYNVNGQRVANMSKAGLYIVDGKKVVVK